MPQDIVGRTDELMQRYGLAAGNVTYDQLKSTVSEALQAVLAQIGHRTCEQEPAPTESKRPNEIFMWGGALHRLPKDYVLTARGTDTSPSTFRTAAQAYMRWHLPCRATGTGLPALKKCSPQDFSLRNSRKRFSDWRILCNYLDGLLIDKWLVPRNHLAADLTNSAPSPALHRRRVGIALEIHWQIVKTLHPHKRKRRGTNFESALRVSTVLKDIRSVASQIKRIKRQIRCYHGITRLNEKVRTYWLPKMRTWTNAERIQFQWNVKQFTR